jgi:uncharacterized membrane protein
MLIQRLARSYTGRTVYSKHRIEGLSDAIFAIVMTLLVLELKVPTDVVPGHLWDALRGGGESWLAFFITFFIAARYWMLQHNVFKLTQEFTHHAVILTFVFLGLVTILPFSSSLVGRHASEPLAFVFYCINQSGIGLALIAKLEFLRIRDHIPKSTEMRHLRVRLYTLTGTMAAAALCARLFPIRYMLFVPVATLLFSRILSPKPKHA